MSFLEQLKISLGDFRSYRRLSAQPFGRSFSFLVLFLLVIFVVGGIRFSFQYKAAMTELTDQISKNVPDFTLANGKLSVDGPMPIQFASEDTIVVIDTSGQIGPDAIDAYSQGVYIDADRIISKQPAQTRQILFSELGALTLTKADVVQFMGSLDWLLIVFGIIYFIWLIVSKMFGILILSLVALIANGVLRTGFEYPRLWNVALYSMVVPTIVSFGRAMVGVPVPNWWIIHWGIAVAYIVIALKTARDEVAATPPPPATL